MENINAVEQYKLDEVNNKVSLLMNEPFWLIVPAERDPILCIGEDELIDAKGNCIGLTATTFGEWNYDTNTPMESRIIQIILYFYPNQKQSHVFIIPYNSITADAVSNINPYDLPYLFFPFKKRIQRANDSFRERTFDEFKDTIKNSAFQETLNGIMLVKSAMEAASRPRRLSQ